MSPLPAPPQMHVIFVDHIGDQGGGQLALGRFLARRSSLKKELVLFQGGELQAIAASRGIPTTILGTSLEGWRVFGRARKLTKILRRSNADAIVVNSLRAAIVISLTPKGRSKYIYYLREDLSRARLKGLKRMLVLFWVLPRFEAYLANSQWTASTIPRRLLGSRPVEVAYPQSGLSLAPEIHLLREATTMRIVSISRLVPWKGLHLLLEACQILEERGHRDEFEVALVGGSDDAEYVTKLKEHATRVRVKVEFVGHVKDVTQQLERSDVSVVLSTAPEPFGQVVLQGMAAGTVVVACGHGGPSEVIVDGQTGILIRPNSSIALADTIEMLLRDPEMRKRLASNARNQARSYSDELLGDVLESAIRRLTNAGTS